MYLHYFKKKNWEESGRGGGGGMRAYYNFNDKNV